MSHIKTTVTQIAIHRSDQSPVFGEGVINVSLWDEGAGTFIVLTQNDSEDGKIRIDPNELDIIVESAKRMLKDSERGSHDQDA